MATLTNEPEATIAINAIPDSQCGCDGCVKMCIQRPCWPTPAEAKANIDAGFGNKLNLDWWMCDRYDNEFADIYILGPATVGHEGSRGPDGFIPMYGPCAMLTDDKRCILHEPGLKPVEGRKAMSERDHDDFASKYDGAMRKLHGAVAGTWNNKEGQELVKTWADFYGLVIR